MQSAYGENTVEHQIRRCKETTYVRPYDAIPGAFDRNWPKRAIVARDALQPLQPVVPLEHRDGANRVANKDVFAIDYDVSHEVIMVPLGDLLERERALILPDAEQRNLHTAIQQVR